MKALQYLSMVFCVGIISACANNQLSVLPGGQNIDAPPKSKPYTAPSNAPGGILASTSPVIENQWYWKQSGDKSDVAPPATQKD